MKKNKKQNRTCYQEEQSKPARLSPPKQEHAAQINPVRLARHKFARSRVSVRGLSAPSDCNNSRRTPSEPPLIDPSPSVRVRSSAPRTTSPSVPTIGRERERVGLRNFFCPNRKRRRHRARQVGRIYIKPSPIYSFKVKHLTIDSLC